jgi:hypothetical protein
VQCALVHPVFRDKRAECVDVAAAQGGRHLEREGLHACQGIHRARLSSQVGIAHGTDGFARHARLPSVNEHESASQLVLQRCIEGNSVDVYLVGVQPKKQRTTECRGVVVLVPARDAQLLHLGRAALRRQRMRQ